MPDRPARDDAPLWRLVPSFDLDHTRAQQSRSYFWRFHLPIVALWAGALFLPPVRAATGVWPFLPAAFALAHLFLFGSFVYADRLVYARRPRPILSAIVHLGLSASAAISTGHPGSPLWGFYSMYVLLLAVLRAPSVLALALVALLPAAAAGGWHLAGLFPWSESLAVQAALGGGHAIGYAFVATLMELARRSRRQEQARRLEAAEEEERRRIARDLHDRLGATLAQVSLWQGVAARATGDAAREALERAQEQAVRAAAELRACAVAIGREDVPIETIAGDLRERAARLCEAGGARLDFELVGSGARLNGVQAHHLVALGVEAISNAVRHGQPRVLQVRLACDGAVRLLVQDDGAGFDPGVARVGHGLATLRERAGALGGRCEIVSAHGQGTRVEVVVPAGAAAA